ncbi:MAG TPA: hypothetical protein VGK18_11840 [Propionicimonas sp.]|jgi:hypothetical protein|uniref:hypothetical protein n=1 Tax=Propionicimonas sp. TaxID=1955623 RepID=UPI002F408193
MTNVSDQAARHAVEPAWRPRWAVGLAWLLTVIAGLAILVLTLGLIIAGSWAVVILMMLWPEIVASIVVAASAIAFLVRGGRNWFYLAVGATAVAVVTGVVYLALNQ